MVDVVASLVGTDMTEDRVTKQTQVADGIQDLVADKFILKTQAFRVENALIIDNDRIFE